MFSRVIVHQGGGGRNFKRLNKLLGGVMTYSIYNFLRNTKEKTKALDQMASYIHHNTDMKVYLFLTLENYAEFEVIQEHHHGRIVWAVNAAGTGPFEALDPYSFDGLVEFDGKDVDIDPGGAFYSTDFSFDGLAIMADTVDFPEKAKEVLVPDAADFPESFDDYLLMVQEQDDDPDPIEAKVLAAGALLVYSLDISDTVQGETPGELFLSESVCIGDARGEVLMYRFFDPNDADR